MLVDRVGVLGKCQRLKIDADATGLTYSCLKDSNTEAAATPTSATRNEKQVPQSKDAAVPEVTLEVEEPYGFSLSSLIGRREASGGCKGAGDGQSTGLERIEEGAGEGTSSDNCKNESGLSSGSDESVVVINKSLTASPAKTSRQRTRRVSKQLTETRRRPSYERKCKASSSAASPTVPSALDISVSDTMKITDEMLDVIKRDAIAAVKLKAVSSEEDDDVEVQINNHAKQFAIPSKSVSVDDNLTDIRAHFGGFLREKNRVISVNDRKYLRLNLLGKGGSTSVYRVLSQEGEILAYKKVEIRGAEEDCEALCSSYANEIEVLLQQ